MSVPLGCNPDLLERIPLTARAVLDIGCGTGATLARYRARNPHARLYGVEPDRIAARLAASCLDECICGPLETVAPHFGITLFDCILLGDSLQRMADPWSTLRRLTQFLAPGGVLVLCVANIEHWSFTHALICGGWAYQDHGLLDRRHLRWFTAATLETLLDQAGLKRLDGAARVFDASAASAFTRSLAPALATVNVDPSDYLRRAAPLQYVWRAVAQDQALPISNLVSTMLDPVGGVSDLRVVQPIKALAREPDFVCHIVRHGEIPQITGDGPRFFILHRPCLLEPDGLDLLVELIAQDFVVICEFDDHPDHLPVLQRPGVLNFRAVHAIQTTTPALAAVLAQRNPHVAVFPNAIDEAPAPRNFANPDQLTLFFGAINREQDWPDLIPALNEVLAEADGRLAVHVVGDSAFFAALDTPYKHFTPLCTYPTYLNILAACEISLMPLRDTAFNRCKSNLKHLEASAARVLSLASPVVYNTSITDGRTGLLFRAADELRQHLRAVLANPSWARSLAEAARMDTLTNATLAAQTRARRDWYGDLWRRRASLASSLYARMPALHAAVQARKSAHQREKPNNSGQLP